MTLKINKLWFIAAGVVIFLVWLFFHLLSVQKNKYEQQVKMTKVLTDSLMVVKNKLGQSEAHASVVEATKASYFLQIQGLTGDNKQLQDLVRASDKKYKDVSVAIVYKDNLILTLKDSLSNVISGQTIEHKGDSTFIYPIYSKHVQDRWIIQDIRLGKNIFEQKLQLTNEYNEVIGEERDGLFKSKHFASVTPLNPNVTPTTLKVYEKIPTGSKFKVGFISLGIGVVVGLLIHLL